MLTGIISLTSQFSNFSLKRLPDHDETDSNKNNIIEGLRASRPHVTIS